MDPEALRQMAQQMDDMWKMVLSQMTAAGASRQDIIATTLTTAVTIVEGTSASLWPDDTAPDTEDHARKVYAGAIEGLRECVAGVTHEAG